MPKIIKESAIMIEIGCGNPTIFLPRDIMDLARSLWEEAFRKNKKELSKWKNRRVRMTIEIQ